ncbi:cysteine/glutathione ABC transporter permease/ATP-binding protein CydD [Pantoea sp. 1.19]|uniref:heme ABC transporter permease/ATP-binding protein CydD n=1 Tax=Pantoea sp. 1.19 TaxID=1925589 RepID=UPI000948DFC7|nr:cysteine/glutathione ABC transporter permease/ATP-binding protein CydD [Pantoea sp. 1.19]
MEKSRQRQLIRWLKQQSTLARRWLRLAALLGSLSAALIIAQAWLLADLLWRLITLHTPRETLLLPLLGLLGCFVLRALFSAARERVGFHCGREIRRVMRQQVLDRLQARGPATIQGRPAGSWATLVLEQIDDMQDYYARYLPQMTLAVTIPLGILLTLLPINWAAALILLVAAPLIPLFMALVGMGAADANRRNFAALARLSGHFLDRLRGMETIRLYHRGEAETEAIRTASERFRLRTMDVLRLAFLSSAVLEFFASLSIAVLAVYFGFSYLGELNFGHYGQGVTLFAGFLALILAPEFFQPLRDLGTFYHAKAQAVGAADALFTFLEPDDEPPPATAPRPSLPPIDALTLEARDWWITARDGTPLVGPLNFTLRPGQRIAIVGQSGAGKSSLIQALMGFLPCRGSLYINGRPLADYDPDSWRQQLSWVGQNPHLPGETLRENLLLSPRANAGALESTLALAGVSAFLPLLPAGLDTPLGDQAVRLSVGQAQRVAVARALLTPAALLLLDEPSASLDADSERHVMRALDAASHQQTTLMVTHQLQHLSDWDEVWVMRDGQIVQRGDCATLQHQPGPFRDLLRARNGEDA